MSIFERNPKVNATLVKREGPASSRQAVSDSYDGLVEHLIKQGIVITDQGLDVFHRLEKVYSDADFTLSKNWLTLWSYIRPHLTEGKHYLVHPDLNHEALLEELEKETDTTRARALHGKASAAEATAVAARWFDAMARVYDRHFNDSERQHCIEWVAEHGSLTDPKTWDKLRLEVIAQEEN